MPATRATASTSPFLSACARISRAGCGVLKETWPTAVASRALRGLDVMPVMWIVLVGVRWGRVVGGVGVRVEGVDREGAGEWRDVE